VASVPAALAANDDMINGSFAHLFKHSLSAADCVDVVERAAA